MKKIITLISVALLPLVANAYHAYVDGIYYNFRGDEAEVTYRDDDDYNSYSGAVVIPESVTYNGKTYSVTAIGSRAFYGCVGGIQGGAKGDGTEANPYNAIAALQYVTSLPADVPSDNNIYVTGIISYIKYSYNSSYGTATYKISVDGSAENEFTVYGSYYFNNQPWKDGDTQIQIGDKVLVCGKVVNYRGNTPEFADKKNWLVSIKSGDDDSDLGLTSVTIPESVTSIGYEAFCGCTALTSVTIPEGVTSIGRYAFSHCFGLTSINIPSSVTSIGDDAFWGCTGLTAVHITDLEAWCKINFKYDSNPLTYAQHLFLNGEEVTDLIIPESVTSIGRAAFSGCSGLTSIIIPENVTSIGLEAFMGCSSLTSVTLCFPKKS